ncbi:MAG: hypothetical protein IKP46_07585 [Bacteroidales bacterium]|nr:hypothetical protein [Bacteroidales bacterium]
MKIDSKQIDALNSTVKITLAPADYEEAVKKRLSERRRTAELKGFRKGMAPASLINRLYGEQALYEAVNRVVSDALNNHISEKKLRVVGEPLPSEDQPENKWENGADFSFSFDIATTPEINVDVDKSDKVVYYQINVTKEAREALKKNILGSYGTTEEAPKAGPEDYIIADLDNGTHKVDGAYISLRNVAGAVQPAFVGIKAGDSLDINVNEVFENETDRAALLKVKKEELPSIDPAFKLTVVNVKTFVPAKESQETYDKIYGEGVVKSAEEFDAKIDERLRAEYAQMADSRFARDLRDYLVAKAAVDLPEAFLKRWLFEVNEGKYSKEQIEHDFPAFLADFRWQMVKGSIMKKLGLKVEKDEVQAAAYSYAAYQYAMYGFANAPKEMVEDYAKRILTDERQARQIEEQVEDNKTIAAVRELITLENKKISEAKFKAL